MKTQNLFNHVLEVLNNVKDEEECYYDHHGYCQAHCWFSKEECVVKIAKRILPVFENFIHKHEMMIRILDEIEAQAVCGAIAKDFEESLQMLENISKKCDFILKEYK